MKDDQTSERPIQVALISLGCAKNLVDAELMLGSLMQHGLTITNEPSAADAVIVNTCSFIDAAQEESVNTILESAAVRETQARNQALIVAGCLTQRYPNQLPELLPEVDAFVGIDQVPDMASWVTQAVKRRAERTTPTGKAPSGPTQKPKTKRTRKPQQRIAPPILEVHKRPTYVPDYTAPRYRLTPNHTTYLKIAEGCNHPCSFCTIPRMRGRHRSRTQEDILAETRLLIGQGVRELNLISQDTTYYGLDLRKERKGSLASPPKFEKATQTLGDDPTTLVTLLRALSREPGDFWIRLLYTHPAHWTDALIETMADSPKVARYIDIPLQHIHSNLLERMRRETSRAYIEDLIGRLRAGIPRVALRTTFIVGFPGETEEAFESLLTFIRETQFERLGVFAYSPQDGTRAANMADQIPEATRLHRRDRAMAEQQIIARTLGKKAVGRKIKVLIEQNEETTNHPERSTTDSAEHGALRHATTGSPGLLGVYSLGRSEADAPEIDGRVYVQGRQPIGEFVQVRVTGATDYDLIASPV